MKLWLRYTPPDKFDPHALKEIQETQQQVAQNPELQQKLQKSVYEPLAQSYETLEYQNPTFNITGKEATYMATRGKLIFVKIDGKWYIKQSGDGN